MLFYWMREWAGVMFFIGLLVYLALLREGRGEGVVPAEPRRPKCGNKPGSSRGKGWGARLPLFACHAVMERPPECRSFVRARNGTPLPPDPRRDVPSPPLIPPPVPNAFRPPRRPRRTSRPAPERRRAPFRIAINGYGIGRCYLRALHEAGLAERYRIVAINEPADLASIAYLTRFDSTHGRFPGWWSAASEHRGRSRDPREPREHPEEVDWMALGLDLVVECSGQYGGRRDLQRFIDAGCPRLLLSHPGNGAEDVDVTVVFGINEDELRGPGAWCLTRHAPPTPWFRCSTACTARSASSRPCSPHCIRQ